ncbi:MAG: DUF3810 domain-containing protein [Saprospiraceae bacterium]|nr:DUF3810 domain-containing protein [Saprospiraceae bacterium]
MNIKAYIWIVLGLGAIALNGLFGVFPVLYEWVYFKFVFQIIRVVYDYILGWIPFPMVYVLFLGVVQLIYSFIQFKGFRKARTAWGKLSSILLPICSLIGAILFFFYVLWGFNYQQKTLSEELEFPKIKADSSELYTEALFFMNQMKSLRSNISSDTIPLSFDQIPIHLENEIRENLEGLLNSWDIPTYGRVRVRKLYPKGTLLRISTAGVYIPFVFEGHIDAGLHPIQYPFTMAHEMSHGYGLADEGTCNFTGFLACMKSDDKMIQYSAMMSLWRYMANNLRRGAPFTYKKLVRELDANVRRDLIAVMDEMDKYPDILPKIRNAVYDTYLKSHGVKGGMTSYSTVVKLMLQWKDSGKNPELKKKIYGSQ